MLILSFDPSINHIGWCVMDTDQKPELLSCGTFNVKGENELEKCQYISKRLASLVGEVFCERAEYVLIEKPFLPFGNKNGNSLRMLCLSVGAIASCFQSVKIEYVKGHKTKDKAVAIAASYGAEQGSNHCFDAISQAHYWIGMLRSRLYESTPTYRPSPAGRSL